MVEINGWNFKTNGRGTIYIVDDKGNSHRSLICSNNRISIEKSGTSRIYKYPKFVIDYVYEQTVKETNNDKLIMTNEIKKTK